MTLSRADFPSDRILTFDSTTELGQAAAKRAADVIRHAVSTDGSCSVLLASAPSQEPVLTSLFAMRELPWEAVTFFHVDEYVGLDPDAPQLFASWLRHKLDGVPYADFEVINSQMDDPEAEGDRYETRLLARGAFDVALLGVGVNGHIAFNEPDHADFADPRLVRLVDLDLASRQQQVDEGLFSRIDEVPKQALTLTVPALLNSRVWLVSVLGRAKGAAVRSMLTQPISEKLPATIVRKHPQAWIYLDRGAASSLDGSTP